MASGAYQRKVGQDHNLAIAQTTVSKYLGQVLEAINSRYVTNLSIKFATQA